MAGEAAGETVSNFGFTRVRACRGVGVEAVGRVI